MSIYVLVHGAWGGAHGWRRLRPLLTSAGHEVLTPCLTGLGERSHLASPEVDLSTHIQDVQNAIWYEDLTDVILIGHSYAGMVVTGVADRLPERISHLVYLDAFLPADGQSAYDLQGISGRTGPDWRIDRSPVAGAVREPDDAWYEARRSGHPVATLEERIALRRPLEDRPFSLTYVAALGRDRDTPAFDRAYAQCTANTRWRTAQIVGGHSMQRTNPEGLARLLADLFPSRQPAFH